MMAVTSEPHIEPRPLARIRDRVRLLRRGLEAAMDRAQFDPMLSELLDQVIALEETLSPVLQEPERAPHATRAQATTCPWCGAPRRCCAGSAAPGKPTDHGVSA